VQEQPTGYELLLRSGIVQRDPCTATISDLLCFPICVLVALIQCSLVAPEISSSKAESWREMSLNLADVASLSCYAKFFNMT
jgi:hypothetical protein